MAYDEKEVGAGKVVNVYNTGDDEAPLKFKAGQTDITDDMKAQMTDGLAQLDPDTHKVKTEQLPSYVDDVVEGYFYDGMFFEDDAHTTPMTPESGKIYVDVSTSTGKSYRWSGSQYIAIAAISSDDPHVVIYVTPGAHEVVDPAEKNSYFSAIRYPGMDPFSSQYDDDVREACAQYIFSRTLGYGTSGLDSSIAILRVGDESNLDETFNVMYIYMENGGGKYVLEMSDGAKVTIDRGNTVHIGDKDYCTWDFIPASAPEGGNVVFAHIDYSGGAATCDLTAYEIRNLVNAGKLVVLITGGTDNYEFCMHPKCTYAGDEFTGVYFFDFMVSNNGGNGIIRRYHIGVDGAVTDNNFTWDLTTPTP